MRITVFLLTFLMLCSVYGKAINTKEKRTDCRQGSGSSLSTYPRTLLGTSYSNVQSNGDEYNMYIHILEFA